MVAAGIIALFVILGAELAGIVGLVTYLLIRQKRKPKPDKLKPDGKVATNYGEPETEENGKVLLDYGNGKSHSLPGSVESSPDLKKKKPIEEDVVRVDVEPNLESPPEVVVEPTAPYDDKPPTVIQMDHAVDESPIVPLDALNEEEEPLNRAYPEDNDHSEDDKSLGPEEEVDEPLHEVVVLPPRIDKTKRGFSSSSSSSSAEDESLPDSRTQAETLKLESSDDDRDLSSAKSDEGSPKKIPEDKDSSFISEEECKPVDSPLISPLLATDQHEQEPRYSSEDDLPHSPGYERPPVVPLTVDDEKIEKMSSSSSSDSDEDQLSKQSSSSLSEDDIKPMPILKPTVLPRSRPKQQERIASITSSDDDVTQEPVRKLPVKEEIPEYKLIEPVSMQLDEKDHEPISSSSSDESFKKPSDFKVIEPVSVHLDEQDDLRPSSSSEDDTTEPLMVVEETPHEEKIKSHKIEQKVESSSDSEPEISKANVVGTNVAQLVEADNKRVTSSSDSEPEISKANVVGTNVAQLVAADRKRVTSSSESEPEATIVKAKKLSSSSSESDHEVAKALVIEPVKETTKPAEKIKAKEPSSEEETRTIKNVTLKPVVSMKRIQRAEVVRHRATSATSSSSSSDKEQTKSVEIKKSHSMTSQTSQTSSDAKSFDFQASSSHTRMIRSTENVEIIQEENIHLKKERKSKKITRIIQEESATSSTTEEEVEYVKVKKPKKKKKKKRRIIVVESSSSSTTSSSEEEIIRIHKKKKKEKKAKKTREKTIIISASSSSTSSTESEVNIPIIISPTPSDDPHFSTQYHYDVNSKDQQRHITTTIINRSPSPMPYEEHRVYREILEVKKEKPQTLKLTLTSESDKELTPPTTRETSTFSTIVTSQKGSSSSVVSDESNKVRQVSNLEVALSPTSKKTFRSSIIHDHPPTIDHEEVFVEIDNKEKESSSSSESEEEKKVDLEKQKTTYVSSFKQVQKPHDDVIKEVVVQVEAEEPEIDHETTYISTTERPLSPAPLPPGERSRSASKILSETNTRTTTITTEEILVTTTTQEKRRKSRKDIHFLSGWQRRVTLDDLFKAGVVTETTINELEEGKIEMEAVQESLSLYLVGKEPIAGLLMSDTGEKMRIFDAWKKGLIRRGTSISLLEAQAATGRIIDPVTGEKMSVADASKKSVIDRQFEAVLVRAERAVYGYQTRLSAQPLSLFEAMKRHLVVENHGVRLLEAQIATGGIVDPKANHRLPVEVAFERGLFDERLHGILEDPSDDTRGFFDPNTEENLTYLELMERCVIDKDTGLRLLPFKIKRKKEATKVSKVVFESATKRQVLLEDIVNAELVDPLTATKYDKGIMTTQEVKEMVGKLRVFVDGTMPIAGVINSKTGEKMSIVEACRACLIRKGTAFELLEAQAACGKIIDVQTGKAVSMETAIRTGVIDSEFEDVVSRAGRAVTGYREPFKREVLSLSEAMARHLVVKKHAVRLLEAQIATGGIVDIKSPVRISVKVAQKRGLIEYGLAEELDKRKTKSFFDPVTGENMNYSELMGRCVLDKDSNLLFLMIEGGTVTQNVRPFEPEPASMNIREKPPTGKLTTEVVKTKQRKRKSRKSKKTTTMSTSSTTPPSSPPAILSRRVVIVDPESGKELSVTEALELKLIDEDTARQLLAQEGEWVEEEGKEENK